MTPAATSSATTAATCTESSSVRKEKRVPGSADPCFNAPTASRRVACSAGASPDITQETRQMPTVNASTVASGSSCSAIGVPATSRDDLGRKPRGQEDAGGAGNARQYEALRQKLPDEAGAARAERQPHRDFAPPRRAARELQVADVGAREQQHEQQADEERQEHCAPISLWIG